MLIASLFSLSLSAEPKNIKKEGKKMENPKVEMKTNYGAMTIELYQDKAPETVKNFLAYVNDKFYDGTIFHRVIDGFMIQGGGFESKGANLDQKKTKAPIKNEAKNGLKNKRGTLAMARTSDPHSATAQFFINHRDNDNLDYPSFDGWGYAVFGKLTDGENTLDKIAKVKTTTKGMHENVPMEPVVIESVTLKK